MQTSILFINCLQNSLYRMLDWQYTLVYIITNCLMICINTYKEWELYSLSPKLNSFMCASNPTSHDLFFIEKYLKADTKQSFSLNSISVTHHLLLPSLVLNMGHGALIFPRGHVVTCSITCPLLGKLPDVYDHAVGRANPVMTQTVNWLQSDLYPRLSRKVEMVACENRI